MIELIATDLDETLLSSDKSISERNLDAIQKAMSKGIIIVPATGRGPNFLGDIPKQLGLDKENNYSILANGALTIDNKTKEIIDIKPLDFQKAQKLYKLAYNKGLSMQIFTTDIAYYLRPDEIEINFANQFENSYKIYEEDNIDFLADTPILKMAIIASDLNYLMSLEPDIAHLCNWNIQISYSSDRYMEINKKGVNKGLALIKLCKKLNIPIGNTLAIGDNYNDKEMLEKAGTSVAVQNAHLLMKEISDYITIATNNEGAVGEAIEKFVLQEKVKAQ